MLQAGKLRHHIAIQAKTHGRNDSGDVVEVWATRAFRAWASVEPLKGRELFTAQQVDARLTHRVMLRYLPGITAEHRILHGLPDDPVEGASDTELRELGVRILHILSVVDQDERHRMLELMCMEAV